MAEDGIEPTGPMTYLHETERTTLSGEPAGNSVPVSFTDGGDTATAYAEGLINLAITVAVIGIVLSVLMQCTFCFACCCGCFGGDRRQATCCRSSKPQELPEGTDLGLGPSSSTAASPELLHERSAAVTSSPNETPAEAALAPPPAVVRCFGREISQKWCNRGMLIAMVVIAIIYFSLVMVAFGSINNVGDGTNSMIDGARGVLDIMKDFSGIMDRARAIVLSLVDSILAVRDEVPPFAVSPRASLQALANQVRDSTDALNSAQDVVDNFVTSLDGDLDSVQDLVSEFFLRYATAYAGLVLSGVLVLGITLLPFGLCVPVYKCGIFSNLALLVLVWLAAAVTMPMGALMSDICIEPGPSRSIINLAQGTVSSSTVETLEYYLLCANPNDPNPPGAYGSIVEFSRESNAAIVQVFQVKDQIENDPALAPFPSAAREEALADMAAQAFRLGNVTQELVALGSCTSIGGRVYRPVVKALCEEVVGAGIAQFWAVHIAMGVFLLLLMGTGVWFCHGVRHPGGEKNRIAAAKHLRAEQLRRAAANGFGNGMSGTTNPVGSGAKQVEMPLMAGGAGVAPAPSAPGQYYQAHSSPKQV